MAGTAIPGLGYNNAENFTITPAQLNKKPAPKVKNPGLGKQTVSQQRYQERKKNPVEPLKQSPTLKGQKVDPKVDAFIKDYIKQMRAAGYPDHVIKQKLIAENTITIPDTWQPGGEAWTGGMAKEFNTSTEPGKALRPLPKNIPGASGAQFQNYMPGGTADRLPSYGEYSGRNVQTPYMNMSGQFSQNEQANLRNALAKYMGTYKGETVPMSQWAATAGVAGLPNDLANQWMPEKTALDEYDKRLIAEGDKTQAVYQQFASQYPEAGILPTDTVPEMIAKMATFKQYETAQGYEDKNVAQSTKGYEDLIKVGNTIIDDYNKGSYGFRGTVIPQPDGTGKDLMVFLQETIMNGAPIETIMQFIQSNNIPLTTYQITGLMAAYGKY